MIDEFNYSDERFADIQMLRYRLKGFEGLELNQKIYIYCLAEAALCGRDITTDQKGRHNLRLRKVLEAIYTSYEGDRSNSDFCALTTYLKCLWFANGIHHHYGCDKFVPEFSEQFFRKAVMSLADTKLPLYPGETRQEIVDTLSKIIFDPTVMPMRVNKKKGDDLVLTSACNYYEGVTQHEAEDFYNALNRGEMQYCPSGNSTCEKSQESTKQQEMRLGIQYSNNHTPSFGLNTRLVRDSDGLKEQTWKVDGMYGAAIKKIVHWLEEALEYAENEEQHKVLSLLITYYHSGDLRVFDEFSIEWLKATDGVVDFINGFIEVYGDPLGIKGSWEGFVSYKDTESTLRAKTISDNAQWFEDNSPVAPQFRKKQVKGVVANVVCAVMLGGDEYPSSAIGINLPNADWIRAQYGSKSITICNLTEAYSKAARGSGFREEFVIDNGTMSLIEKYGDVSDDLHTDLHECLGHGSGRVMDGVNPNALGENADTIEEARADLFALYYIADKKIVELGLLPDEEAYKSQYYTYMMNGILTQLTRIKLGHSIEEAHMRNRALIARWVLEHANGAVELIRRSGKTYLRVNDYAALRTLFAALLAEIQRIKSEGDYDAAQSLIEKYAVDVDEELHKEMRERYERLNIAPYKGFINPWLKPKRDENGRIIDIDVDYTESYDHQMLRYSSEYGFL